jgi:Family of unknown function (DUF6401)
MSEISLRLAGAVGACGLGLAAGSPGVLAAVDQHAAEVRNALTGGEASFQAGVADLGPVNWADEAHDALGAGRGPVTRVLLGYARGFVEAAMGRGWVPAPGVAMDWESLRLAAVCLLLTQSQAAPLT